MTAPATAPVSAPALSGTRSGAAAQFLLTAVLFAFFRRALPGIVPGPLTLGVMAVIVLVLDLHLVRSLTGDGAVRAPRLLEAWIRTAAASGFTLFMLILSLLLG